jgi:hypothetical protein
MAELSKEEKLVKAYETHGVIFTGDSGDERIGTCPFTGKENKFYLNVVKGVWDSKTFGRSGGLPQFLELIFQQYSKAMTPHLLKGLGRDRHLPVEAFIAGTIGWTGSRYALAVRDTRARMVDLRLYTPGRGLMSTPTASTGLFGAQWMSEDPRLPIFICEGEWDAMAWQWALKEANMPGAVVGVPGASTMKRDWAEWFVKRDVIVLYDNDDAGCNGDQQVYKRVRHYARSLKFLHWPPDRLPGFDIRDHVVRALELETPMRKAVGAILALLTDTPREPAPPKPAAGETAEPETNTIAAPEKKSTWLKAPSYADLEKVFNKWLFLENTDALRIMLATTISQALDGPPIWVFLVAPPGGSKTEHLNSLIDVPTVYMTSSLTPHSLISGANWKDGADPSLIPRLNGKVMVIKDFTAILGMRDSDKEEIFAILRDAYDGRCGKVFGNGVERSYESRFTVLGAVTPRIYDLSGNHASLGERFLKFGIGHNLHHVSEQEIIRRAIRNINRVSQMQEELADATNSFLTRTVDTSRVPTLSEEMEDRLIHLGMFGARLRGSVSRDTYKNDIITSRPSAEIGSRLGVQLAKLAKALAMVVGRPAVIEEDYRLVKKVMLDTIPQRGEDVLRVMLELCPTTSHFISRDTLAERSKYPGATIHRLLQDMLILDVVAKKYSLDGDKKTFGWTVSEYIRNCVTRAGLYTTQEEVTRTPVFSVRVKRARHPHTPVRVTVKRQSRAS